MLLVAPSPTLATQEYVANGAFGSEGAAAGEFEEPLGLAVDDSIGPTAGEVYVVDRGNSRVERFSSAGAYLGDFDGSGAFEVEGKAESGAPAPTGAFSSPEGIAIDDDPFSASAGDVYVADVGHKVVDKFSPEGDYLGQLTETIGGSPRREIHGVSVDWLATEWVEESEVAEISTSGVDEFSAAGVFMGKFETGLFAGPPSEFEFPGAGLTVDSEGDVYVNTCCEGTVVKFNATTHEPVAEFGDQQARVPWRSIPRPTTF